MRKEGMGYIIDRCRCRRESEGVQLNAVDYIMHEININITD
jgi:hypothetical protein